jgi:DNA-binding NtrC family response regulator
LEQRPAVLVVNDDTVVRKTLAQILKTKGYMVETKETGKQAILQLQRSSFSMWP